MPELQISDLFELNIDDLVERYSLNGKLSRKITPAGKGHYVVTLIRIVLADEKRTVSLPKAFVTEVQRKTRIFFNERGWAVIFNPSCSMTIEEIQQDMAQAAHNSESSS